VNTAALVRRVRAGMRSMALLTAEEDRAQEQVDALADALGWAVHVWSAATGADGDVTSDLTEVLRRIAGTADPAVWTLLDPGAAAVTPQVRRQLRELTQRGSGPLVFMVQSDTRGLEHIPELGTWTVPLPDASELAQAADDILQRGPPSLRDPDLPDQLARAAVGLPRAGLEQLVREATLRTDATPGTALAHVRDAKPSVMTLDGALERVSPAPVEELGGLEAFKTWLARRALALRPEARQAAIPAPRGVLLVGVQGCGKSLAARVTATVLDVPLFRLDPGRLFGGTVGESEQNLRRTLATIDRLAPAVLWVDEVDKGLSGAESGGGDSGTTARVIGGLLTWLQERERPVFVAATANHVTSLPPELLRRGRLDEVFFVDLPGAEQRAEILRVHLERIPQRTLGQAPPMADPLEAFGQVARAAVDFSGAELEGALVEARLEAFAAARPVSAADFQGAVDVTVPLARSRAESIAALRLWARERARMA
jgi:SpoVK/Ycf46/Vps4 family AAA+-type ATPase